VIQRGTDLSRRAAARNLQSWVNAASIRKKTRRARWRASWALPPGQRTPTAGHPRPTGPLRPCTPKQGAGFPVSASWPAKQVSSQRPLPGGPRPGGGARLCYVGITCARSGCSFSRRPAKGGSGAACARPSVAVECFSRQLPPELIQGDIPQSVARPFRGAALDRLTRVDREDSQRVAAVAARSPPMRCGGRAPAGPGRLAINCATQRGDARSPTCSVAARRSRSLVKV